MTTGILLIEGAVYCSHPLTIFIAGALGLGFWCSACMICLLLVLNRVLDILFPTLVKKYFSGSRTTMVLMIPVCYGLYFAFFTPPLLFTSKYQAWFFDPFIYESKLKVDFRISTKLLFLLFYRQNPWVPKFSTYRQQFVHRCRHLCTLWILLRGYCKAIPEKSRVYQQEITYPGE